jgi:hypothetical protein
MANLKQGRDQSPESASQKRSYLNLSLPALTFALFLSPVLLFLEVATAQQESSIQRKADLEIRKLELEVAKLQDETRPLQSWFAGIFGLKAETRGLPSWLTAVLTGVLGVVAGIVGTTTTVWVDRRRRQGALDQSVHDKRLEFYPELVRATQPLAIYFPPVGDPDTGLIGPKACEAMGRAMSGWYFGGGGLLMSVETRNAYFSLTRALTCASLSESLNVPAFPQDAKHVSDEKLKWYRKELAKQFDLDNIENWSFGSPGSEEQPLCHRFKDYVFLQRLSSELRTRLAKDLRSRRRPS